MQDRVLLKTKDIVQESRLRAESMRIQMQSFSRRERMQQENDL